LLILTSLVAVPLIYPLQISEVLDYRITQKAAQSPNLRYLWLDQFQPALFAGYSPLSLKRIVWAILTLALGCTHLLWKLLPDRPREAASHRRFTIEHVAILGFTAWAGISLRWLPNAEATQRAWGGFLSSLDAWTDLVIGVGFFFLTVDLLRRRRWVFKGVGLLIGCGTIIALLAVGQRQGWTASFLTRWSPEQARNTMASLIGQNTGLASFLMAPLLVSLVIGLPRWRQLSKPVAVFLGLFWFLMFLTLVMAQSRAVFLILIVAIPLLLWKLHRNIGLSPGRGAWIFLSVALVLVLLSQAIPSRYNPFFNASLPLTRRLQDFGIERLRAETRLRILVCSIPLVLKAPLQGHGFGSFQYVYPKAQGEYFLDHPNTLLVPTGKRTERAHNEYLQTLIETGVVGLGLAFLALVLVLRRGWLAYSHTLRQDDIPIQIGLLTSILVVLAHALVDFPLRVAPIALPLIWMLAAWEAGGKIWLPRRGRHIWPEDEDTVPGIPPGETPALANPETPFVLTLSGVDAGGGRRGSPSRWFLWSIEGVVVLALSLLASSWYSRRLAADVLTPRADHIVNTYVVSRNTTLARQRVVMLREARSLLRRSLRLRPVDGNTLFLKGFSEYFLGQELLAQSRSAADSADKRVQALWLNDARSAIEASLVSLNLALSEIRTHQVYHIRGEDYQALAVIENNPDYLEKARADLERAIQYSPAYPEAIVSLARLIERSYPDLKPQRDALLSLLFRFNPDAFYNYFVIEGDKAVEDERYQDAIAIYRDLTEAVPEDDELLGLLASTYLVAGDIEKTEAVMTEMAQLEPRPVLYDVLNAIVAINRNQWQRALAHLNQALSRPDGDVDYYRVMRAIVLKKMGETEVAERELEAVKNKAKSDPRVYIDLAGAYLRPFEDVEDAIPFIEDYLRESDLPLSPHLLFVLARYKYEDKNMTADAIRLLKQALRLQPDHAPSRRLLREILESDSDTSATPQENKSP